MNAFVSQRSKLLVATFAFLVVAAAASTTVQAGKPAPPFTFKYRAQFIRPPAGAQFSGFSMRMNNSGTVVGRYVYPDGILRGFLFDSATEITCWDLSQLVTGRDLVPAGWIFSAASITDSGKVTGTLCKSDGTPGWAYVLDTADGSLRLLDNSEPAFASASATAGYSINDGGDVLGKYFGDGGEFHYFVWNPNPDIEFHSFADVPIGGGSPNDSRLWPSLNLRGQVAGALTSNVAFRYTPWQNPAVEYFLEIGDDSMEWVNDMNDDGVFCGRMAYHPKKGPTRPCPYRYDRPEDGFLDPVSTVYQQYYSPVRINSSRDLMVCQPISSGGPGIYHEGVKYLFFVDDRVDVSDLSPEDLALWSSRKGLELLEDMTDRYLTGASDPLKTVGRLCGNVNGVNFVLTPVYPTN